MDGALPSLPVHRSDAGVEVRQARGLSHLRKQAYRRRLMSLQLKRRESVSNSTSSVRVKNLRTWTSAARSSHAYSFVLAA